MPVSGDVPGRPLDTLLITGGSGRLGSKIIPRAAGGYRVVSVDRHAPSGESLPGVSYHQVDLLDGERFARLVLETRPACIIHAAALTDVDACEADPEQARLANVVATENVATAARRAGARLVFLSTDYVFSGEEGPYDEGDAPRPPSVYGRTKLEAERVVATLSPAACIARTSTLYGFEPGARPNFATWVLSELREGRSVTAVTDQVSSPTLVDNLADMVMAMVRARAMGIYHAAGAEWMSRYDFVLCIARCFGLDTGLVLPVASRHLKQLAQRPRHSGLRVSRVRDELGVRPLGVEEGLLAMRSQEEDGRA